MGVKRFVWDEVSDNVLLETDDTDTVTARYCQCPERFGELLFQERNGTKSFYHYDGNASTCNLTNSSEAVTDTTLYTACGEPVSSSGSTTNPFGYKGAVGYYTNDSTGDIYVRNRSFEPTIGRWLSIDPLGFIDGANLFCAYFVPNGVDPKGTQKRIRYKHKPPHKGDNDCGCWLAETEFTGEVDHANELHDFDGIIVQQVKRKWNIHNCDGSVKYVDEIEYFEAWIVVSGNVFAQNVNHERSPAVDTWGTCAHSGPDTYGTQFIIAEFGYLSGEDLTGWLWPGQVGYPPNAISLPGLPFPPPNNVLPVDRWIKINKNRRDLYVKWSCCPICLGPLDYWNEATGVGWTPIEGVLVVE